MYKFFILFAMFRIFYSRFGVNTKQLLKYIVNILRHNKYFVLICNCKSIKANRRDPLLGKVKPYVSLGK